MSSILCSVLFALATLAATAVGESMAGDVPTAESIPERSIPERSSPERRSPLEDAEKRLPLSPLELELRDLVGLDEQGIEVRLLEPKPKTRDLRSRALIALAGRDVPPGFPAAWGQRREAERSFARAYLRARLDDPRSAADWRLLFREILENPNTSLELWSAAARLTADLALFELTPELGAALDLPGYASPDTAEDERPIVSPAEIRRSIARRSLHRLYLRWFESEESVRPLYEQLDALRESDVFRRTLIATDRIALERSRRLIELRPADAPSRLDDLDPRVKAQAATAVARAVGERVADPVVAIDRLLGELESNAHDAGVFHAVLQSLIEILASAPPNSVPLRRLRSLLAEVLASSAPPGVRISIASGLSRLPWGGLEAEPGDGADAGLRTLAVMVEDLTVWRPLRDDDEIVFVLQSLLSLGSRASANGLDVRSVVGHLCRPLYTLFSDGILKPDVRSAAGRALATFIPLSDLGALVSAMENPQGAPVPRIELIGVLQRIGPEIEVGSSSAKELTDILVQTAGDQDSDLRRKALDVLRDPKLAKHTSHVPVHTWLRLLEDEKVPALSLGLIDLVQLTGNPDEHLSDVWNSPSFPRVSTEDARVFAGLVTLLREWCASTPERVQEATGRLLSIDDVRLRAARIAATLQLAADLDSVAAASFEQLHACSLLERVTELRRLDRSALLAITTTADRPYLERLADPSLLEACAAESEGSVPFHLRRIAALLSADLWSVDPAAITVAMVSSRFQAAIEMTENSEAGEPSAPRAFDPVANRPRAELLRERARFHAAAGLAEAAVSDFSQAFRFDSKLPEGVSPLLSISDLRRAGELSWALEQARRNTMLPGRVSVSPGGVLPAPVFLEALLARAAWLQETPDARMGDLRLRLDLAADSGTSSEASELLQLLDDLPPPPLYGPDPEPSAETETEPEVTQVRPSVSPLLEGLALEGGWLVELHDWRSRLEERSHQLSLEEAPAVQPAGFEPEPSADGPEGNSEEDLGGNSAENPEESSDRNNADSSTREASGDPAPAPIEEAAKETDSVDSKG